MLNRNAEVALCHRATFGSHIVSFSWFDQPLDTAGNPQGEWRHFSISSFVMSFGDQWCLITAGHILEALDNNLKHGRVRMFDEVLNDAAGAAPQSTISIPFSFRDCQHFFAHDKQFGIDCGAVLIPPGTRRLLEVNRIIPIPADGAVDKSSEDFEHYFMIGIPTISYQKSESEVGDRVQYRAESTLCKLPIQKTPTPLDQELRGNVRSYFRLLNHRELREIDGMSGSPIFGLTPMGKAARYQVVALQFAYNDGVAIACPTSVFVPLIRNWLKSVAG